MNYRNYGKIFTRQLQLLRRKKGIGFNYQLLLIDRQEDEIYLVESTMKKIESAVNGQKEERKRNIQSLTMKIF